MSIDVGYIGHLQAKICLEFIPQLFTPMHQRKIEKIDFIKNLSYIQKFTPTSMMKSVFNLNQYILIIS